jgi:hypothetical protein
LSTKTGRAHYEFEANLAEEDRVRIYLDNWLVIDKGSNDGGTVSGTFEAVGAGPHTISVEYQDFAGEARIEVDWDRDD